MGQVDQKRSKEDLKNIINARFNSVQLIYSSFKLMAQLKKNFLNCVTWTQRKKY